ncbi:MAG: S1/P1 nuclease [Burkholderiales bacterium]
MRQTFCFDYRGARKFPLLVLLLLTFHSPGSWAWGDVGHEVVARVALHFMAPSARARVEQLLATDTDTLTPHDPVSVAVWADRYRETHYHTHEWHFVDLDLRHPSLLRACHGHPALPVGTPASEGPASACVVDKIEQFTAELHSFPMNSARPQEVEEARRALKFLIHFVGDLHQPLHAINNHDRGGNEKRVSAPGARAGTLHHYWDTTFVERLGPDSQTIAARLIPRITPTNLKAWQRGTPQDWAMESFQTARTQGYESLPPPDKRGHYRLSKAYLDQATETVALQLEEAGVRLALLLDKAL